MSLEADTQLGTYRIVGPLGAGGMGEVYRACDTRLDREVAIKVLPDVMAHDPERVARFEREAKLLASLSHQQIAAIYGFEEADDKRFLVLELVEGPTLADRLADGPLMVEESLDIARQIAEALEAAHEKNIIHRDLKPANVKITPDGQVKILDFGLAKALAEESTEKDPSTSPTITRDFTQPGVILGTAAYMSPEQARGRPVDKRSDIWSFGCVLYECLTGDSMFLGETVTDSIGAILHKQPDWEKLPTNTPPTIQLLLRRCLAKERKRRLRDIGDVRIELEAAIADPTSSSLGLANAALAAADKSSFWNLRTVAAIATSILLTVVAMLGICWSVWPVPPPLPTQPPLPPVEHFTITLPQRESNLTFRSPIFDVSDDGKLAYRARNEMGGIDLLLRPRDQMLPRTLVNARRWMRYPTFSHDGQWLAYYADGAIVKQSVQGGPATTLSRDVALIEGMTWSSAGFIVYTELSRASALMRVDENSGKVTELKIPGGDDKWFRFVHALPEGQAILYAAFTQSRGGTSGSIGVYSLETGEARELVADATYPLYAKSKHLLFLRDTTLMAVPFDVQSLDVSGQAVPVIEDVQRGRGGAANVTITNSGTLYYREGEVEQEPQKSIYVHQLETDGKPELLSAEIGLFRDLAISPDARLVALEVVDTDGEEGHIWLLDTVLDLLTPLSSERGFQESPIFSPDGLWVYYSAFDDIREWRGLFRRRSDLSGGAELVEDGLRPCVVESISTNGNDLFIAERPSGGTNWDLAVVHLGENGQKATREPWYRGPSYQTHASVSPNGQWVAYMSGHAGGRPHLYVRQSSGEGAIDPVSRAEGGYPVWSPDGQRIYFQSVQDRRHLLLAVDVLSGGNVASDGKQPAFEVGRTTQVLELGTAPGLGMVPAVAMMPDGKSFLRLDVARREGEAEEEAVDDPAVIHVVRNLFTKLEQLAPTKKPPAEE